MSVKLMSQVWDLPFESVTQKIVMLALADNASDQGRCWPSVGHLAKKCQVSERCVFLQLARLKELKFITCRSGGGSVSNHYTLTITPERSSPLNIVHPTPEPNSGDPCTTFTPPLNDVHTNHQGTVIEPSFNQEDVCWNSKPKSKPVDLKLVQVIKERLAKAYKRKNTLVWKPSVEIQIAEISQRPGVLSELDELLNSKAKRGKFFTQALEDLLPKWDTELDRARNSEDKTIKVNQI